MKNPLVSVVMPIYGRAPYLEIALDSIVSQTAFSSICEVILVFDRADKSTIELISERCKGDFWRVFVCDEPGIVGALNLGVSAAKGDLIARFDSDDIMMTERIEIQLAKFRDDPNLVLLGGQVYEIDEKNEIKSVRSYPEDDETIRSEIKYASTFAHPSTMFRRAVFSELGGYRRFYELAEDYDLWLRMLEIGSVQNCSEILIKYRIHSEQVSAQRKSHQLVAELASKVAFLARQNGKREPSDDFQSLAEWWADYGSGFKGKPRRLIHLLRVHFYSLPNGSRKSLLFCLLMIMQPRLGRKMLRTKLRFY